MSDSTSKMTRRKLLTRLTATAAAIYVAPALTEATGEAEAWGFSHRRKTHGGRKRYSHHSKWKSKHWSRKRSYRRCKPKPPVDVIPE